METIALRMNAIDKTLGKAIAASTRKTRNRHRKKTNGVGEPLYFSFSDDWFVGVFDELIL